MFGLDPLSRPVAIAEILVLLAFVAFVGWLLGRLMLAGRVNTLRLAIDDKKAELDKCRSEKATGVAGVKTNESVAFKPVYPYEADESETPQLFVSADPLLPAYSHEDTPVPIVNDELAAEIMDASATEPDETPVPATYPEEETEPEAPHLFVSADPILPAYSHDDTPELLVDDALAAEINEASATADAEKPASANPDEAVEPEEDPASENAEAPQLFVSTDPLLPIYSYDDTPEPLVDDELADDINEASAPVVVEKLSLVGSAFEFPADDEPEEIVEPEPVVEDRETVVLNRVKARVSEVNFERIGRATAVQADDLKDIVGVGPFLERKLHTLGIYTFRQVANFTKEDIEKINEIIEFFPGRIEDDNWVGQAKAFYERKYGAKS